MPYPKKLIVITALVLCSWCHASEKINVLGPQSKEDVGHSYYLELLQLVIEKSHDRFSPSHLNVLSIEKTTHGRSLFLLERGTVDVFWAGTNVEREQRFIPIRLPLFYGLLGYRVSIIHRDNIEQFKGVLRQPSKLKTLSACQGEHWPDSDILEDNGYKVVRVSRFDLMFSMLAKKRCDYFPRAIFEGYGELIIAKSQYPELVMFDDVILHYQFPIYLFVNRENIELAQRLTYGLEQAFNDGSIKNMMMNHPMTKGLFPLTKWQNKHYITLKNKYLSDATPFARSHLWIELATSD